MDFYALAGPVALSTRLRALAHRLTEDAPKLYELYGAEVDPRWFPVLFVLSRGGRRTVTEMARMIGQSHAAISQVVKAMSAEGLINAIPRPDDGRVRELDLTDAGRAKIETMQAQIADTTAAIETLLWEAEPRTARDRADEQSAHESDDPVGPLSLWTALERVEQALDGTDFYCRVLEARRQRVAPDLVVREFVDADADAFAALNRAWIETHFRLEAQDSETLAQPRAAIVDPGGVIFMARSQDAALGTVALIPMLEEGVYELAKMSVAEHARGLGIGRKLGEAALAWAVERGATRIYLECNTKLKAALALYRALGFTAFDGPPSPYARVDIQMERILRR